MDAGPSQQEVNASHSTRPLRLCVRMGRDLIQAVMPSFGDRVPVRLGQGVEFGVLNGFVQVGVHGVQDIQDGDEGGGSSRLDSDAPRKSGRDNCHDPCWRVCSSHRKVRERDAEAVRVCWEGNIKAGTTGVGKEIMQRGWSGGWRCGDKLGAGEVGNNWALFHRRERVRR